LSTVVFYVSGHGFGHASRDIEVINALRERRPDLRVIVRTGAPKWLFDLTVRQPVEYHPLETDTGIAQIDSLHLDVNETVQQVRAFMRTFDDRATAESAFLRHEGADLVVADIPALGIAAATAADIPAIALGNFTWDWIYSAYPGTEDVVESIGGHYHGAELALRLPMHGGFSTFRSIRDLPFVARRSRLETREARQALGFPLDERLVLVSFGGYGLEGLDLDALTRLDGYVALVSGSVPLADLPEGLRGGRRGNLLPVDEPAMYASGLRYEDVVRAVDVVITKPGYGIIAECLANDAALLYTSRGPFIEFDVLTAESPNFLRTAYIDHASLFAGRWKESLDALLAQPAPREQPAVDGADVAAGLLLARLDEQQPQATELVENR
jgi:L-arabinokinase